ncbi:putative monooxygenase p33MONOX isoform X3 [Tupaia chinensis]|uniref:putative monooxygenase p33MONOX isoform X3 n=1 Tax=Tupaia chinensis TaxID=246437 RepID=UPI0003C91137|nr:putative monooxygenase p33MONOX isoform X3 [Tupaia chinensis]
MASRQPEVPALEPSGPLGKMSLPIGMCRRAFSYDDALEDTAPMTPPPADMSSIPWKPVIPERKYQHLAQVEEGEASVSSSAMTLSSAVDSVDKVPVVKAKATHVIMNSLITKQTQESIHRFEQQAGLRDAGYTPHKGLTTEETKYLRVAEALHKLKLQSGEITREEKHPASAQSTPSSTPHSSPKHRPRTLCHPALPRCPEALSNGTDPCPGHPDGGGSSNLQAPQDGHPSDRREETTTTDPQSQAPGLECAHAHWLLELSLSQGLCRGCLAPHLPSLALT